MIDSKRDTTQYVSPIYSRKKPGKTGGIMKRRNIKSHWENIDGHMYSLRFINYLSIDSAATLVLSSPREGVGHVPPLSFWGTAEF